MMYNIFVGIFVISLLTAVCIGTVGLLSKTMRKKLEVAGSLSVFLFVSSCVGALIMTPEPSAEQKAEQARAKTEIDLKNKQKSDGEEKQKAEQDAACRNDVSCIGEKKLVTAGVYCRSQIERLAKYSSEWTDGFLEPKFSHYRLKAKDGGVVTFIGDKIKFQNGFGAWQNMIYECDLDTKTDNVLDVRASPGRI